MKTEEHLSQLPGKKLRCDACVEPASLFARCASCRRVLTRCGNHGRSLVADRAACCGGRGAPTFS